VRRAGLAAALTAAVLAGVVATVAFRGGTPPPAQPPALHDSTATIRVTNLATTVLTGGTLGYAAAPPVINQLAGTYTSLPRAGRTIRPGQVLYRVDNQPVVLMTGRIPAWRPFAPGMTSGPDIAELQASLIGLGYASGLLASPTGQYDLATDDAVQRWQAAVGYPVTGQVALGQLVFLPAAIRIGSLNVSLDQSASPGERPFQVTTRRRSVTVPLSPTLPPVSVGERVQIVLPSQARTPGRITAVRSGIAHSASSSSASTVMTVTPDRPAATGTGTGVPVQISVTITSVRHVLAVPVSALLALAGGGYALQVVTASGRHHLVGIRTGIFAGGMVQVSGASLAPGTKVVVTQ
jgi:peptidoglycan hydrolase-like protein with peptidoglycan-binding domain